MTTPSNPRDHVAWLHYWREQMLKALRQAITRPPQFATEGWDLDLEHVVRCARSACSRSQRLSATVQKNLIQRSLTEMSSKDSRRSIKNGARQSSHTRPAAVRKAERAKQEQIDANRKPGSSPYDLEPGPSQAEVDEAFEAVTGHKRPAPIATDFDEVPDSQLNQLAERMATEGVASEETVKKVVDSTLVDEVVSPQTAITLAVITPHTSKDRIVTFKLKGLSKNGKRAIYAGARSTFQIALTNFEGSTAPDTFEASGPFVGPVAKEAKPKMTAEERKAARAAKPKPTLAERAAKAQARAQRLAELAAAENQPSA